MGAQKVSHRAFRDLSHYDFIIDKNSSKTNESNFYKKYKAADKNKNGLTYDEYLIYLKKKSLYNPTAIELKLAKIGQTRNAIVSPSFHNNGNLSYVELDVDLRIQGINFFKESKIFFRENGTIVTAYPSKDTVIKKIKCKASDEVRFFDDKYWDKLWEIVLAEDTKIDGISYKSGTHVDFNVDKTVYRGTLAKNTKINGLIYKAGTSVWFRSKGNLITGTLAIDTYIQGIRFEAGTDIYYSRTGILGGAKLPDRNKIQGIQFYRDDFVCFDNYGHVIIEKK